MLCFLFFGASFDYSFYTSPLSGHRCCCCNWQSASYIRDAITWTCKQIIMTSISQSWLAQLSLFKWLAFIYIPVSNFLFLKHDYFHVMTWWSYFLKCVSSDIRTATLKKKKLKRSGVDRKERLLSSYFPLFHKSFMLELVCAEVCARDSCQRYIHLHDRC